MTVSAAVREITNMALKKAGITSGLVNESVLVTVMLNSDEVALVSSQNEPPSATLVVMGNVMELNPEFVMEK
jgi:hypothetical protein